MQNRRPGLLMLLRILVLFPIAAASAVAAKQVPDPIGLIHGQVLPVVTDSREVRFTPSQEWIYEPRVVCSSLSLGHEEPVPITVEVSIIPDNPDIKTQTEEGTCVELSSFTMARMLLVAYESYTFKVTYKSFDGAPIPPPSLLIVTSALNPDTQPANVDTALFKNGAFIGSQGWTHANGAYHEMTTGPAAAELGSVLFTQHDTTGNGTPQSSIGRQFIPPFTGIYRLQFACQSVNDSNPRYDAQYRYTFTAVNEPPILPASAGGSCSPLWQTVSHDILLLAGYAFDFSLEFDSVLIGPAWVDLRIDNLSLTYLGPADDLDTGVIENGEFIGYEGWSSDDWGTVGVALNKGVSAGQLGSMHFLAPLSRIDQTIVPAVTDVYVLQFTCYTESALSTRLVTPKVVITANDAQVAPAMVTHNCANTPKLVTARLLLLAGKAYRFELVFAGRSAPGLHLVVDNLQLLPSQSLTDADTGLIKNGDFIGHEGWTLADSAEHSLIRGQTETQLGAGVLPITAANVSQIVSPAFSGQYVLTFACQGNKARGSWHSFRIVDTETDQDIGSGSGACAGVGQAWTSYQSSHDLVAGKGYRVEFKAAPYTAFAIDNVSLRPLLLAMPESLLARPESLQTTPR